MTVKNKTALITGATSGFGVVIAKHLVQTGYSVIILARSKDKIEYLMAELMKVAPNSSIESFICDLSSFQSITEACYSIKKVYDRIDLFILNAGVWNFKFIETEDKIEETLQVNLLSPVLIFQNLKNLLPADESSKVIFTSSGLHQGAIHFSDIEFRKSFSGFKSYRQSKLGIILMTRLYSKKEDYSGISFYCVHPGMVNTKLGRNAGWFSNLFFKLLGKTKEKGALTHKYLIDQPTNKLASGEYYSNCRVTRASAESYDMESANKLENFIHEYFESSSIKKR